MHEVFPPRAVEQLNRFGERRFRFRTSGGAGVLDRGTELAALRPIARGVSTGLTHLLFGGLDTGQSNLGAKLWSWKIGKTYVESLPGPRKAP